MSEVRKDCPSLQDGSCQEKDCTNCAKHGKTAASDQPIVYNITEADAPGFLGM